MGCPLRDTNFNVDHAAALRCTRCRQVWYCDQKCQRRHWKHHKLACAPARTRDSHALPRAGLVLRCENPESVKRVYPYDDYTVERMDDGEWVLEHRVRSRDEDNDTTIVESRKMLMSYSGLLPAALSALWEDAPSSGPP